MLSSNSLEHQLRFPNALPAPMNYNSSPFNSYPNGEYYPEMNLRGLSPMPAEGEKHPYLEDYPFTGETSNDSWGKIKRWSDQITVYSILAKRGYIMIEEVERVGMLAMNILSEVRLYMCLSGKPLPLMSNNVMPEGGKLDNRRKRWSAGVGRNVELYDRRLCHWCGATETPEWRRGPDGPRTLCNACGLKHAKKAKKDTFDNKANLENNSNISRHVPPDNSEETNTNNTNSVKDMPKPTQSSHSSSPSPNPTSNAPQNSEESSKTLGNNFNFPMRPISNSELPEIKLEDYQIRPSIDIDMSSNATSNSSASSSKMSFAETSSTSGVASHFPNPLRPSFDFGEHIKSDLNDLAKYYNRPSVDFFGFGEKSYDGKSSGMGFGLPNIPELHKEEKISLDNPKKSNSFPRLSIDWLVDAPRPSLSHSSSTVPMFGKPNETTMSRSNNVDHDSCQGQIMYMPNCPPTMSLPMNRGLQYPYLSSQPLSSVPSSYSQHEGSPQDNSPNHPSSENSYSENSFCSISLEGEHTKKPGETSNLTYNNSINQNNYSSSKDSYSNSPSQCLPTPTNNSNQLNNLSENMILGSSGRPV